MDSSPLLSDDFYWDEVVIEKHTLDHADGGQHNSEFSQQYTSKRRRLLYAGALILPWMLTIVLSIYVGNVWAQDRDRCQQTFSPVQSAVEYGLKTFEQDITDAPAEFRNPDTVDEAWFNLYDCTSILQNNRAGVLLLKCWCPSWHALFDL